MYEIDAKDVYYRELNNSIREAIKNHNKELIIENVCGQYYIGCGLSDPDVSITIHGVPGNDLGAFMNGPEIVVHDNVQDGVGNTMNGGRIVVYGNAGDVLAYSMRGGSIFVEKDVGYRACIHMKAYKEMNPTVVVGGCAGAFMGEYMAGGTLILLGLTKSDNRALTGHYLATGMHGGAIFIRGEIDENMLWNEAKIVEPLEEDYKNIKENVKEFCNLFKNNYNDIMDEEFVKVVPKSTRPYGHLYIPGP
jgi:glutamate synthase domain-containing protein 3